MSASPPQPPESAQVTLRTTDIELVLLPDKGADIFAFIDRASGIDVLFKSPWGWRDPTSLPTTGDSQVDWLARYPGGWQILFPNAGPERLVGGVVCGYHGEAALRRWDVIEQDAKRVRLAVTLSSVPVRLERSVRVAGTRAIVRDTVHNLADTPVEYHWVQHPAFGAPFIDGHCRIVTPAATMITDGRAPGTVLPPDAVLDISAIPTKDARRLSTTPDLDEQVEVFGALTDFLYGSVAFMSPTAGFGVALSWDRAVYPHAWFWQECHSTAGFPWYREAYAVAIEPANSLPGDGLVGGRRRGQPATLAGGAHVATELVMSRVALNSRETTTRTMPNDDVQEGTR